MLSVDLCKKLISSFGFMEGEENQNSSAVTDSMQPEAAAAPQNAPLSQADINGMLAGAAANAEAPVQPQQPQQPQMAPQGMPAQGYPQQMYAQPQYPKDPRLINVQPIHQNYEITAADAGTNLDLIMKVPLQVSVEIGRTKKLVKEILEFGQGSLVVLDKLAGDQVDVYVNGQCIAKGDVVVVDDNFGVRITEVIKKADIINSL
jgi:flagellar motor switch protein FliN/FliY